MQQTSLNETEICPVRNFQGHLGVYSQMTKYFFVLFSGKEFSTEAKQSTESRPHDSLNNRGDDFRVFHETEKFHYGQVFILVLTILRSIWRTSSGGDFISHGAVIKCENATRPNPKFSLQFYSSLTCDERKI